MSIITITVKCDLDNDEIFGRVHVQTTADKTLDWLLDEFCTEKRVKRKPTFALRSAASPELELSQTIAQAGLADGETIFAYNKNPPPPPTELPRPALSVWWILAACALIVGAVGLVSVVTAHLMLSRPAVAFSIVVDSGTSSSKAYTYTWRASKYRGNGVVSERAVAKTTAPIQAPGGVDQMVSAVAAVRPAVPAGLEAKTRLYLGATAGMRMYRQVNATLAESVLAEARTALRPFPFDFGGNFSASVRILEGEEEARAGWVAVNYLKGGFGDVAAYQDGTAKKPRGSPQTATFGSLDLGAGSAEIAFAVAPTVATASPTPPDIQPVTVYGRTRQVYAHSFLCYGKDAVERRALGRAISDALFDSGKPVDFPCWQRGYVDEVFARDVFVSPCSDGLFIVPAGKLDAKFLITGSGDSSRCRLLVARFFSSFCDKPSCSFNNVYQPELPVSFVAFAGYFYVANFFNLTAATGRAKANLTEVSILVDSFCSQAFMQLPLVTEARLRWYCFDGIYVESLLRALGFNDTNWGSIEFLDSVTTSRVEGNQVLNTTYRLSWPLGYAILQSAEAQPEGLILPMPLPLFIFLTFLSILLLALSVVFACLALRSGGGKRRGYNPF